MTAVPSWSWDTEVAYNKYSRLVLLGIISQRFQFPGLRRWTTRRHCASCLHTYIPANYRTFESLSTSSVDYTYSSLDWDVEQLRATARVACTRSSRPTVAPSNRCRLRPPNPSHASDDYIGGGSNDPKTFGFHILRRYYTNRCASFIVFFAPLSSSNRLFHSRSLRNNEHNLNTLDNSFIEPTRSRYQTESTIITNSSID